MTTTTSKAPTMNALNRTLLLASAALVALAGCNAPELVDRTQPNYVKKSDLTDGTWYIQDTIVDAPKTPATAAIVGFGGKLEKIRWEVQENLLVGYRAYEIVPGADPRVDHDNSRIGHVVFRDGRPYKGNPVYAFKILSHFDRQRQYNASTGEQTNVLVEDTADRPWYDREYMRVDWRTNVLQNLEACTTSKDSCTAPGTYFHYATAQDQAANDEQAVFARDASGKLTYFDFTTQLIADPPMVDYPGYGMLPYCLLNPEYDCESQNVKVRTSVRKVDEARVADYEPLIYGEKLNKKFGLFRNESVSYDKEYYYTESGRQLFAMRHNLWAHAKDATGKTIPVTQRAVRPVVYYLQENTPRELWPAAMMAYASEARREPKDTIEHSWDKAFRKAVAVPRGLEPYDPAMPQMFYVCPSPVPKGAPEACGPEGTYARPGDLRYNMIPYVQQNAGGLLGLGPSSMDPETGEVVQAVANIYGVGLDTWAGSSAQVIDVLNGDVTLSQLVAGKDIKDYVLANLNPTDPRRPATGPWSSQQPLSSDSTRPSSAMAMQSLDAKLRTMVEAWRMKGQLPLALQNRKAVVDALIAAHPSLENELINLPELKLAVDTLTTDSAFKAKLGSDPAFYHRVARNVLLGVDPIEQARDRIRHTPNPQYGCFYEYSYSDEDYLAVAKRKLALQTQLVAQYKAQGDATCAARSSCTDAEALRLAKQEVYNDLRREAYRSVTEHEIGHTLGLMHNFIGSADALNYQDGYWNLRKETIGVTVAGQRVLPMLPQNLLDAARPNQHQLDQGMYEYTYSSIMDYGARVNSQNLGVGKYDEAAILFSYSGGYEPGWVEVFNQTRTDYARPNITVPLDNKAKVFTVRGAHVEMPLAQVEHYTPVSNFYTDKYHYSTLPFHFADQSGDLAAMLDQGVSRMGNRSYRRWSEMTKHYDRIEAELKNFILSETGLAETDFVRAKTIINAAGGNAIPVEVPYMFCSDYEVGANLLCNRNDQGADVYEMTSKWLERFNQSYVFTNFRRDRLLYSPATVASGKFGRYLGNVPNVYQQWLFNIYYLANYYSLSPEEMDKYYGLGDPMYQNYWTMAVMDSTNTLMEQLAVPSVGYHGLRADGSWEYLPTGDTQNLRLPASAEQAFATRMRQPQNGGYLDVLYIPRGPGRSMYTVYDSVGYDSFTRVNEAGHFWDVYAAMLALTTSETNFLGVDRGSDALKYSLPYYLVFNRELAPLFSAYWTENKDYYAPAVAKQADGTGYVRLPTFLKAGDYIQGFQYPPPAPSPVDGNGNAMALAKLLPNPTWSARFYSQVWGMAFFTDNFNQEYASFNKIFRLGSGESLDPIPPDPGNPNSGFDVVSFPDPFGGGYVYAALKKRGAVTVPSAGAYMIDRANAYKAKWDLAVSSHAPVDGLTEAQWEAKVRDAVRTLEMMRGLYDIFGRAI